ncbi:hypothetical protein SAMN04487934_11721 [Eubacterium ruminantium]|nr:hypothetical protein SAMN04487934_11721 [Eubacterium ruminantium]
MFGKGKKSNKIPLIDMTKCRPALRVSICTGEKTAGFIDNETGKFHDLYLINNNSELLDFCNKTGTTPEDIEKVY